MGLMTGKRGLVMGVANERSIAWGIAKALADAGAELAFSYQGEAFGKRLEPLADSVGSTIMVDVDVTDDSFGRSLFRRPWRKNGASWISSSTPSPFPTRPS